MKDLKGKLKKACCFVLFFPTIKNEACTFSLTHTFTHIHTYTHTHTHTHIHACSMAKQKITLASWGDVAGWTRLGGSKLGTRRTLPGTIKKVGRELIGLQVEDRERKREI